MSERSGERHDRPVHPAPVRDVLDVGQQIAAQLVITEGDAGLGEVAHQHRPQVRALALPAARRGDHCHLPCGSGVITGLGERTGSHCVRQDGGAGPPAHCVGRQRGELVRVTPS